MANFNPDGCSRLIATVIALGLLMAVFSLNSCSSGQTVGSKTGEETLEATAGDGAPNTCDVLKSSCDAEEDPADGEDTDDDGDGDGVEDDDGDKDNPGDGEDTATATDTDTDGIPDDQDPCPTDEPTQDDDSNGCEDDSDGDGVYDIYDDCPDDSFSSDTDGNGCEDDSDDDGVDDDDDDCPDVGFKTDTDNNNGCQDGPEISICVSNKDSYEDECTSTYNGSCISSTGYSKGYNALRIAIGPLDDYQAYIVRIRRNGNYTDYKRYTYYKIDTDSDSMPASQWNDLIFVQATDDDNIDDADWVNSASVWETNSMKSRWGESSGSDDYLTYFDTLLLDEKDDGAADGYVDINVAGYDAATGITDWSDTKPVFDEITDVGDC